MRAQARFRPCRFPPKPMSEAECASRLGLNSGTPLRWEAKGAQCCVGATRAVRIVGVAIWRLDALAALARTLAVANTAVAIAARLASDLILASRVAVWTVGSQRVPCSLATMQQYARQRWPHDP